MKKDKCSLSFLAFNSFGLFRREKIFIARLENILEMLMSVAKKNRVNFFFFAQVNAAINCSLSCVPAGFFLMLLLISFPTVCVLFKEKNGEIFRAVYLWLLSRKLLEALCFE